MPFRQHTPSFPSAVPDEENKRLSRRGILKAPQTKQNVLGNDNPESPLDGKKLLEKSNLWGLPNDSPTLITSTNEAFLGCLPPPAVDLDLAIISRSWGPEHNTTTQQDDETVGKHILPAETARKQRKRMDTTKGAGTTTPCESHAKPFHNAHHPRLAAEGSGLTATGLLKEEKSLFRRRPRVPQRLVPRRRDATPVREPTEKLIAEVETPRPMPSVLQERPRPRIPEASLLDGPAEEWADAVMKDIEMASRMQGGQGEDASTPITTTTGFGRSLLDRAFAGLDGAVDTRGGRAIPASTELAQAFELPAPGIEQTTGLSHPRAAPKGSPNSDPSHATPTTGILSVRQLTPTKRRTETLSPRASVGPLTENDSSRTFTSTSQPCRERPVKPVACSPGEGMALEAAQAAVARTRAADGPQDSLFPAPSQQPWAALLRGKGAEDATGNHSRPPKVDLPERPVPHTGPGLTKTVVFLLLRVVWAYWLLVRPFFDGRSPMRRRLEAGRSTWGDVVVAALAVVFLVLVAAAGVWTFHGMVLISDITKAVAKGVAVLIGL